MDHGVRASRAKVSRIGYVCGPGVPPRTDAAMNTIIRLVENAKASGQQYVSGAGRLRGEEEPASRG